MTILEKFNYRDVAEFKQDFILIMKMTSEIDREYGSIDTSFLHNKPEYEKCLELFSKKYKDLILKPNTNPVDKNLNIFFDVKLVKDVFDVAKEIDRFKAAGRDSLSLINISDKRFDVLEISNRACLEYFTSAKSKSIILRFSSAEQKPELIYDKEGVIDEKSPEFKLCAYYGCLNGFDKKINMRSAAATFYKPGRGLVTPTRHWG